MAKPARLVQSEGGIWRLSEKNYIELLRKITMGEPWNLNELGTFVGPIAACVLDMDKKTAADLLWELKPMGQDPIPDWIMLK
jgi:hypothetical protein